MYIDEVPNRNSPPAILLRESTREGSKIHKRTIANLSKWPRSRIEKLRRLLKDEPLFSPDEISVTTQTRQHGNVELVVRAMRKLGFSKLLHRSRSRQRDLVVAMTAQRLLKPDSKLGSVRLINNTTLGDELGLGDFDEDDLYGAMDWLVENQGAVEKRLARRHLREGGHVLYDVTSSYYEGRSCPLMRFGYNRDRKRGKTIVVYGVLADTRGVPVALRAYPGNTGDPVTVPDQVEKLRGEFGLGSVVLVGDRGMLTETQIEKLRDYPQIGWISALKSDGIRKLVEGDKIQPSLFDERNMAEITSEDYPGERLVVCRNPFLAQRRAKTREELLSLSEEKFEKIAREVGRRTKKPFRAGEIGMKVGKVVDKYKVGKHFEFTMEDGRFEYARDEERIEKEGALDGIYVIRTDRGKEELSDADTVRGYKNLCRIEQAFRCIKTVDLMVRPIRHRKEQRVRAHLFLCMLAWYVEWHMRDALAPVLFADEHLRDEVRDPVLPGGITEEGKRKKGTKKSEDGHDLHSFSTLLDAMGTICRNRREASGELKKKLGGEGEVFYEYTRPDEFQSRVFELMDMYPVEYKRN